MSVARGGIVVALHGAHPAAARPLVLALLEGHRPGDPQGPVVTVCFSPRELFHAPRGARVVLLGADRDPARLNLQRAIVHEHELVVFLWDTGPELQVLRREAPDFLDWVSHRIDVPAFAPVHAMARLRQCLGKLQWVATQGLAQPVAELEGRWCELDSVPSYNELLVAMEAGDVVVHGLARDEDAWRLIFAHAQVRWRHRVLLQDPKLIPPFVPLIDGRSADWETMARRLEAEGLSHARVEAALRDLEPVVLDVGPSTVPRVLGPRAEHMHLLQRIAGGDTETESASLALGLLFDDVAESWSRAAWERGDLRGGLLVVQASSVAVMRRPTLREEDLRDVYERARAIEREVSASESNIPPLELAAFHDALGRLANAAGNTLEARRSMVRALRLHSPYESSLTGRNTAFILESIGQIDHHEGNLEEARADYDAALALRERFAAEPPEHREDQRALAICIGGLGDLSLETSRLAEARECYERARSIIERLARAHPDDREIQYDLQIAYRREAILLAREQHIREAIQWIDLAITMIETLQRVEPERTDLRYDLEVAMAQRSKLSPTDAHRDHSLARPAVDELSELGAFLYWSTRPERPLFDHSFRPAAEA